MKPGTRFFERKNGLIVAYEEYGDPAGEPVIFCHGWPASRLQGALAHGAALELGLRIISPDRPGISLSQFQAGRTLLDWPPLVAELAQALNLGRYRVLGISGGAPYTLATAWANKDAVRAATVVSGAIPLAERSTDKGLFFAYVWLMRIHRRSPAMIEFIFRMLRPLMWIPVPDALIPMAVGLQEGRAGKALMRDRKACEICFKAGREAWRNGAAGPAHDGALYAQPWGFSPREIRVPVRLWHGKIDRRFSWKLAESLASGIPGCATHFVENEGHDSLPIVYMSVILGDLKNAGMNG